MGGVLDNMTSHTCLPDHPGLLADGCERCAEHARTPMLLDLDPSKMGAMWDRMVEIERGYGAYATRNEAEACRMLYMTAIWMERYIGVNPWRPFATLRLVFGGLAMIAPLIEEDADAPAT